jgi:hypothetical protein
MFDIFLSISFGTLTLSFLSYHHAFLRYPRSHRHLCILYDCVSWRRDSKARLNSCQRARTGQTAEGTTTDGEGSSMKILKKKKLMLMINKRGIDFGNIIVV